MQIQNVLQPVTTNTGATGAAPRVASTAWRVGQILQALVLTPTQGGRVELEVTGARLAAETNLALRQGQTLTVRVERTGDPTVLRVGQQAVADTALRAEALRVALPRQAPLEPLMANLGYLTRPGVGQALLARLPPETGQAVRALVGALRGPGELTTAEGLRAAMRESGTFLEALLARGNTLPGRDLKGLLLRLAGSLGSTPTPTPTRAEPGRTGGQPPVEARPTPMPAPPAAARGGAGQSAAGTHATPSGQAVGQAAGQALGQPPAGAGGREATPPLRGAAPRPGAATPASLAQGLPGPEAVATQLRGQVEGALARVQLNQLASLPTDDAGRLAWLAELPVRAGEEPDVWRMQVREEEGSGREDGDSRPWTAELAFNLPGLGAMCARVTLRGETVSTVFWSEEPATAGLVGHRLDELHGLLESVGLAVGQLHSRTGAPPPGEHAPLPPLLDVQA